MAVRTKTFLIDAVGGPEPVPAIGVGRRIRIREKPPPGAIPQVGGTAGYKIFGVQSDGTADSDPHTVYAGEPIEITSVLWFRANQTVAWMAALAGTMTMELIEDAGEI